MNVTDVVNQLRLEPLDPEGGFFRRTFEDPNSLVVDGKTRAASTCILYLLTRESFSAFHRVKGTEIFHFLRGDPAELFLLGPRGPSRLVLGSAFERGEAPQAIVPPRAWQALRLAPGGAPHGWSLFSTTVSPGFEWEDFELGDREALTREFPDEAALIRGLTR